MRTIGMSDYTVGEDCFDELHGALAEYGATKVAIIGGKRALAAALPGIELRWQVPTRDSGDARLRHQQYARKYRQGRKLPCLPGS